MESQMKFKVDNKEFERELFGKFDENIKLIEQKLNIHIVLRESNIVLIGKENNIKKAFEVLNILKKEVENKNKLNKQNISYILSKFKVEDNLNEQLDYIICMNTKGIPVKPKTINQKQYIDNINNNTLTFGIGPAGTGKTYLAVAMAVKSFKKGEVNRIILTRPAVEAGEALGFLPGDLKDKVDPYLRPLYDALFEFLGAEKFDKYMERGLIEVAPLAFMRGRTLDNAFIILDEGQNTSKAQMKMFLTRIGFGSKVVVTGDITQIDLPSNKNSGLVHSLKILNKVEGIKVNYFEKVDVIRHKLVQRIINAYEEFENKKEK
ncbi:MAG: PhoH family protein [Peptostreptococcaceae bacterium]|nr:PhoH family protein [Peptostreptococcaceae bacterium]